MKSSHRSNAGRTFKRPFSFSFVWTVSVYVQFNLFIFLQLFRWLKIFPFFLCVYFFSNLTVLESTRKRSCPFFYSFGFVQNLCREIIWNGLYRSFIWRFNGYVPQNTLHSIQKNMLCMHCIRLKCIGHLLLIFSVTLSLHTHINIHTESYLEWLMAKRVNFKSQPILITVQWQYLCNIFALCLLALENGVVFFLRSCRESSLSWH